MSSEGSSHLPVARKDFSQQGTVDWVNLCDHTLDFSIGVLSRCSNAGIDPYTAIIGQMVVKKLKLSPNGHRNVQRALDQLRAFGSFGDVLWFGFGIKSFVRAWAANDEGMSGLSLAAALSECFQEEYTAEVFHEMASLYNTPATLTPSVNQWLQVVRACSGIFATTTFPVIAEQMISLHPARLPWFSCRSVEDGFPLPRDLAIVLDGPSKAANEELAPITAAGSDAGGWIAAIAEWLYGLSVSIHDGGQKLLHANCDEPVRAQVQIIFEAPNQERTNALECISKTYYLRDFRDLIPRVAGDGSHYFANGRLSWETCWYSTFGQDFQDMMALHVDVGTAFGCAAKLLETTLPGQWDSWNVSRRMKGFLPDFDSASGQGLLDNAIRLFPELQVAKYHMDLGFRMASLDALGLYEEKSSTLRRLCQCFRCTYVGPMQQTKNAYCHVRILETIIALCVVLASVTPADGLCLTRSGLQGFYAKVGFNKDTREEITLPDLDKDPGCFSTIVQKIDEHLVSGNNNLVSVAKLFGAPLVSRASSDQLSALSNEGICVYYDTLRELSIRKEKVGRIHVVPGKIEYNNKPFRQIEDQQWLNNDEKPSDWKGNMIDSTNASLMVTERAYSLYLNYELKGFDHLVNIPPAMFISDVLTMPRAICKNEGCPKLLPSLRISKEYQLVHLHGINIIFLQLDNLNSCALVHLVWGVEMSFLKNLACVQCCLHKALAHFFGESYGEGELVTPKPEDPIYPLYFVSR